MVRSLLKSIPEPYILGELRDNTASVGEYRTIHGTGKSFSEGFILAWVNPQYDNRLFIELPVQYMKIPSSEHVENMLLT